ncbi:MAG: DUF3899 domain-containing protein [Vallitalea sp.]|jgi:hypothetical protein|nr:DUF3899 domain-containing protein [Vallitalea sp.]
MKKHLKKLLFFIIFIGGTGLLFTILNKDVKLSFFMSFLEKVFFINLLVFIITGVVFIDDQGTFNVFKYSFKHFRATVSEKYKYSIKQEYSMKSDTEIKEHLKNTYLYAQKKHSSTTIYFYYSCILLFIFIMYSMISIA